MRSDHGVGTFDFDQRRTVNFRPGVGGLGGGGGKPFAQNILASCSNFYKTVIRVPMTSELSQQRNDAITYYTCSIISHSMKSFLGAFSSNSRLDIREVKTDSVRALSGYFGIKFL